MVLILRSFRHATEVLTRGYPTHGPPTSSVLPVSTQIHVGSIVDEHDQLGGKRFPLKVSLNENNNDNLANGKKVY